MTPVLEVNSMSKTFGEQLVLNQVSLKVEAGEIRALVGQNGCGKSTLIKILSGFHVPDEGGSACVDGEPLHLGVTGSGVARGLRFVHQDLGLVGSLSTVENIALSKGYNVNRLGMIRWQHETHLAQQSLSELGYDIDVRAPVSSLTISERTAVAIARAVAETSSKPRVLILDEPTANLSAVEAQKLFALIRSIAKSGMAVIFVSHHFDEVFGLADSVSVLRDGNLVATVALADLDEKRLISLVVGRDLDERALSNGPEVERDLVLDVTDLQGPRVRSVTLKVHAGEIVGVAGITGSGREAIAGLLFGAGDRSGIVAVGGTTRPPGRPDISMSCGVGLVPAERQTNAGFAAFTLTENITVTNPQRNIRRGILRKKQEAADVKVWLDKLDVRPPAPTVPLQNLSGGNQQKVILARWLREDPKVLLLDEPTQGVDVGAKADIHSLIEQVAEQGKAVLVCSSDHEELVRLCHRVLILRDGVVSAVLQAPHFNSDEITALTIGTGSSNGMPRTSNM